MGFTNRRQDLHLGRRIISSVGVQEVRGQTTLAHCAVDAEAGRAQEVVLVAVCSFLQVDEVVRKKAIKRSHEIERHTPRNITDL